MSDQTTIHDADIAQDSEYAASRKAGGDGRDAILEVENLRMYFPVKSSGIIRLACTGLAWAATAANARRLDDASKGRARMWFLKRTTQPADLFCMSARHRRFPQVPGYLVGHCSRRYRTSTDVFTI